MAIEKILQIIQNIRKRKGSRKTTWFSDSSILLNRISLCTLRRCLCLLCCIFTTFIVAAAIAAALIATLIKTNTTTTITSR